MADSVSGLSGTGGGDLMRITGMATGLDVDGMVKKMMAAEQVKVDKAKQDKQFVQWKQEAYQDIIKDIKDLQSTFFDSLNGANYVLTANNYAAFDSKVTDDSALSITAGVGSQVGNYSISFGADGKLASGAKKLGAQRAEGTLSTTKMADLGMGADTNFNLTYNGTTKAITIKTTDTINDVINNINTNTSGGVVARYSELTRQFTLETSNAGSTRTISIDTDINALGLTAANQAGEGVGEDAVVYITPPNGAATKVTKSSNNFTIDGISYNLLSKTDTTFTVTQNTQKVFDKVKEFLDKYNAVVDKIQTKLTEKKEYSYKPLTDAQKASMKDSDIKAWEDQAKKGVLKNDANLQKMLSSMRTAFFDQVTNSGLIFGNRGTNAIGIDTSKDTSEGGKIFIKDEQKFKDAIIQHADQVIKLFANVSTNSDETIQYNENGIFKRISDIITKNVGYVGTTFNSAILTKYANSQDDFTMTGTSGTNTLPDQIYRKDQLIKKLNDKLSTKQENYYQQFSRLETAMNQLNSQQSWLSQQFGG